LNGFHGSDDIRPIAFIEDLCQQEALEGLHESRALIHDDILASIPIGNGGDIDVDMRRQSDLVFLASSLHFQFGQFDLDAVLSETLVGLMCHRSVSAINIEDGLVQFHMTDFALELLDESSKFPKGYFLRDVGNQFRFQFYLIGGQPDPVQPTRRLRESLVVFVLQFLEPDRDDAITAGFLRHDQASVGASKCAFVGIAELHDGDAKARRDATVSNVSNWHSAQLAANRFREVCGFFQITIGAEHHELFTTVACYQVGGSA
jgi:hypothetical protein